MNLLNSISREEKKERKKDSKCPAIFAGSLKWAWTNLGRV